MAADDRSPARAWCFTWNNPPDDWRDVLNDCRRPDANLVMQCLAVGLEHMAAGTPHLQGYCVFKAPVRLTQIRRYLPHAIHWERRRGTEQQAIDYTWKEQKDPAYRIDFDDRKQGNRTDLSGAAAVVVADPKGGLKKLAQTQGATFVKYHAGLRALARELRPKMPPRYQRTVRWYWGVPGGGKTFAAIDECMAAAAGNLDNFYVWDIQNLKFAEGYAGEECVVIDDLKRTWENYDMSRLLALLGDYSARVEVKFDSFQWWAKEIWVTTTAPPHEFITADELRAHPNALEQLTRRISIVKEFSRVHADAYASRRAVRPVTPPLAPLPESQVCGAPRYDLLDSASDVEPPSRRRRCMSPPPPTDSELDIV